MQQEGEEAIKSDLRRIVQFWRVNSLHHQQLETMTSLQPTILLLGTCDTKLSELLYLKSHIIHHGAAAKLMDVGRTEISNPGIDYLHSQVLSHISPCPKIESQDRSLVIQTMSQAATSLTKTLLSKSLINGVICIGGSGGTSLGAAVMRSALPVGFPKIIVSTVASGNVSSFLGSTDITLMYSVVDIAGTNSILNPILENAAGMIVGAARANQARFERQSSRDTTDTTKKKKIAITMFGVTTPAVDVARQDLEAAGYEVFVFHATGVGGKAMENLIREGQIDAVLDLTTTELADELVGGIMSAGSDRLTAASKLGIPQAVSLGGMDIVNFGPWDTLPERFLKGDRVLYRHNPDISLVRTSAEECRILGERLAKKLKRNAKTPGLVKVFIPVKGISMISTEGGVFCDEVADRALFDAVEEGLEGTRIVVERRERAINDEIFAKEMAEWLMNKMREEDWRWELGWEARVLELRYSQTISLHTKRK